MTLKKQGNIQGSDSFAYQGRGGLGNIWKALKVILHNK